jgi:hypothetical protein
VRHLLLSCREGPFESPIDSTSTKAQMILRHVDAYPLG